MFVVLAFRTYAVASLSGIRVASDRKRKAFTTMSTQHDTKGELLTRENPPTEFDNVKEPAISPVRNTDSDLRENEQEKVIVYLKGRRLYVLTVACDQQSNFRMTRSCLHYCRLCLSLFLSTIETTIISTSLVAITNALDGFQQGNWIVTSYLLTYSGMIMREMVDQCSDNIQAF